MLKLVQTAEMRHQHATDRASINGPVGVPTNLPEYRADVQTSSAADAMKNFPLFGIGKKLTPPIVQKDHMKFLRSVWLVCISRAANQSVITGNRLAYS